MISINGTAVDRYILPPQCGVSHRSRSVEYALDGSAHEDRIGGFKKTLALTFGIISQSAWEALKPALLEKEIPITGSIGAMSVDGRYRLKENDIPTPVMVVINGRYYCRSFTISLEEI